MVMDGLKRIKQVVQFTQSPEHHWGDIVRCCVPLLPKVTQMASLSPLTNNVWRIAFLECGYDFNNVCVIQSFDNFQNIDFVLKHASRVDLVGVLINSGHFESIE